MRLTLGSIAVLLTLSPVTVRAQAPPTPLPSITPPPELDRVLRDYERAWKAGDAATLAMLFTEDGFVLSNGKAAARGRDAIRQAYQGAGGDLRLRALAYATQDSVGYIIGAYRYGGGPDAPDTGKFILALRRSSGGPWLIGADIDNTNQR
ncbi:MAG: YybH family protein [Gemmatimonadales bacterium]